MSCHSWYEAKLLADARIQDSIRVAEKARMVRRVKHARATRRGLQERAST
jgi:hypothetical protein